MALGQTAEELQIFIDDNPFAETVTYTASGGSPATIYAIFDAPFQLTSAQGIQYQNSAPSVLCKSSDVTAATDEATIVRSGTTYKVMEKQPDGTGLTRLILSEVAPQQ